MNAESATTIDNGHKDSKENRRSTDRLDYQLPGKITLDDGQTHPCMIKNISPEGAMLLVALGSGLPDEFFLTDSGSSIKKRVKTVWKRGDFRGVTNVPA